MWVSSTNGNHERHINRKDPNTGLTQPGDAAMKAVKRRPKEAERLIARGMLGGGRYRFLTTEQFEAEYNDSPTVIPPNPIQL